jgi:carbonic anhydrase
MNHTCEALVLGCIDFRFVRYIQDFLETELDGKLFDVVGYPGATKEWDAVMKAIEISERLHHPKQLLLINHEDCGAYGAQGTFDRHVADLHKARNAVLAKYEDVQVDLYYLHLDGTFEPVA